MITYAARTAAGVGLGALTTLAELPYVLLGTPLLAVPTPRRAVLRGARVLAEVERARLQRFLDAPNGDDYDGRRALQYLALRALVGLLALGVWACVGAGVLVAVFYARQLVTGRAPGGQGAGTVAGWLLITLLAAIAAYLCAQGIAGVATLDRRLARRFLGPSHRDLLVRRVSHLATSRAQVVEAVNEERRRIERDLHDGVQQRLVALGLLLGRARRTDDPDLVRQAHEQSQEALRELRDVAWRVYPIALDESGLDAALESLAERAALPVELRYEPAEPLPPALATVVYFVASESVTNATKHAGATRVTIEVRRADNGRNVVVEIADDGHGGARIGGTGGFAGLVRRVAAADGEFTVNSPDGGPTVVRAVLPCD
ncbi:sensor histidine kinase [Amycolatopsis jiangsuensis]|uniref:histidine kinase n=1 Tax=Amycolatopsis jiangsuensis TaxID=1181879 RepID=A0A840IYK2_9PSEU|nr:histidine kinase [Amycolatopsis jiangsuensis]MBB4685944.1 signal transduction histidine kinase [Amycolatopsis jiangsuensis]